MARLPRFDLPGIAQHVVQRGNNKQPCFFRRRDFQHYLHCLGRHSAGFDCEVHAYVLMTNHVHLLLTPRSRGCIPRLMQAVGRDYGRFVNLSLGRPGSLWEGRYKACLVDSERYALACYRYIEKNPVRAGMVDHPRDYPWSSFGGNALGHPDLLLTPHAAYEALASSPSERPRRYREWALAGMPQEELDAIRLDSRKERALGSDEFRTKVASLLGRPAAILKPGPKPRREVTEKLLL
jgi:putative transposase